MQCETKSEEDKQPAMVLHNMHINTVKRVCSGQLVADSDTC